MTRDLAASRFSHCLTLPLTRDALPSPLSRCLGPSLNKSRFLRALCWHRALSDILLPKDPKQTNISLKRHFTNNPYNVHHYSSFTTQPWIPLSLMLAVYHLLTILDHVARTTQQKIGITSKCANRLLPMVKYYQNGLLGLPYVFYKAKLTIVRDYHRWRSHPNRRDTPTAPNL